MKTVLLVFLSLSLYANEFYAKLEPIQSYVVKSTVSGEIIYTNDSIEGKYAKNSLIVEMNSKVDQIDLEQTKNKLKAYDAMIAIEQNNYQRLKKVTTRSDFDKDAQMLKALTLQSTKADLLIKIAQLEDDIKNKKLFEKNRYIYNISVKKGDYVNPGTLLYEAKDLSKAKLEIFIPINDVESLMSKTIYLDNEATDLKIDKVYKVADATHISSYKAEIIVNNPKQFSKLVKIEFK
ncbi:MAG: hypothetical protein ACNI3C_07340 [Candidatus Marinarcus sp.]|uniref:hypothetical protein n=1 Tax=Candidatus Marinarcus sp. TaxID=3100987 RepID=UPI003B00D3C6